MKSDIEDRKLIEEFKNGNENAFEILFERYSKFITRYVNKFVRNIDASEDIMQEVFIVVYKCPNKYNGKSKVINYILAIARNKILTYLRDKKLREEKFKLNAKELYGDKTSISSLKILEKKEESEEVAEILNNMNPTYSMAIKLIDYNELSYKQAAEVMGKNLSQIKVIIHRARLNLEKEMKRKFPDTVETYSKGKKHTTLQLMLTVIIGISMITGLVYATIKLTMYFSQKRETFTLNEKYEVIDESSVQITRERAKEIIDLYLKVLGCTDYDLDEINLIKDTKYNMVLWNIENENYKIFIDGFTGNLVGYNNFSQLNEKYKENYKNEDDVIEEINNLYKKLKFSYDYEIANVVKNKIENDYTLYEVSYAKKYDGIFNYYESVYITYILELNIVKDIKVYNYEYEDKEVKISKEDAINILENTYNVDKIENIKLKIEDISKNNQERGWYEVNNGIDDANEKKYFLDSGKIIKVWQIKLKDNGVNKIIYMDTQDGEIIYQIEENYADKKY